MTKALLYKLPGLLLVVLGSVVLVGWATRQAALVQIMPGFVGMVFNTALCFLLAGIALLLPDTRPTLQRKGYLFIGSALIIVSGLILIENLLNQRLGIDQVALHQWLSDTNPSPGRMAPNTALAFFLSGIALLLLKNVHGKWTAIALQLITFAIIIIGLAGVAGYALKLEFLYSWSSYTRMAIHTGIGIIILGAGLWLNWYRAEWYAALYDGKEDQKIILTGGAVLLFVSISIGLADFAVMQKPLENQLEANLRLALDHRLQQFSAAIQQAELQAKSLGTRVFLLKELQKANAGQTDRAALAGISQVANTILYTGFSALSFYNAQGSEIMRVGTPTLRAEFRTQLNSPGKSTLLWSDQFVLQTKLPLFEAGRQVASVTAERPLPELMPLFTDTRGLGNTTEIAVCASRGMRLQCLPTRTNPQVFLIEPTVNGKPLPMALALREQQGIINAQDYRQHNVIAAYSPIPDSLLGLVVKIDADELYRPIRQQFQLILPILLAVVLLGVVLLRWQIIPLVRKLLHSEQEARTTNTSLRESQVRIHAVVENVREGIITISEQGRIESYNPMAAKMFGYSSDEVLGQSIKLLMPPEMHSAHDKDMQRYLSAGVSTLIGKDAIEVPGLHKNGTVFPMELALSEMILDEQRLFVGIMHDITERKKVERIKNEFISTVSHELRTPLTSIRGSLGLILGGVAGELPAQAKTLVDIAYKNSERLVLLINDILDIEKIESGKMQFKAQPFDLVLLVEQAIEANRAYSAQFNVKYVLQDSPPSIWVNADSDRLMQVLNNLLSNAAKYSPANDSVPISITRVRAGVRVTITDHGHGIPEEFRARIFQRFAQADSSDTRQKGGTGLGLSITQAIVERMGGSVGFSSEPHVETSFYFELPEWKIAQTTQSDPEVLRKYRILVCEDDPDVARLLSLILQQDGYIVDIAYNARQAKQLLVEHTYIAMTLDLALPDQDGISLIRELRMRNETRSLPIVVVSVEAEHGRAEMNGDAFEVVNWLQKPVNAAHLLDAITSATLNKTNGRPSVLHIEDDVDILNLVATLLYEVAEVIPARSLYDARAVLEGHAISLVILDLKLPDGNGLDLLPLLRERHGRPIPVIIFSAEEVPFETAHSVTATLVKSRVTNQDLLRTIKYLVTLGDTNQSGTAALT